MKNVKIYTATPADLSPPVQSESFCVDLVLASDYRELEQKYTALVAENAALKQSEREFDEICREEFYPVWVSEPTKTPATDAAIRNIQAQGVDALTAKFRNEQTTLDPEVFAYGEVYSALNMAITSSELFAARLRQGGEHE